MLVQMSTEVELSACPLCGSRGELRCDNGFAEGIKHKQDDQPFTTPYYWVKCRNKDCAISPTATPDEQSAIHSWNRRFAA